MAVRALQLIRKMRGGAQSHLLQAEDGHCYVVKFANNPQHRRILVNEWIATTVLRYLQIATPQTALIEITRGFLDSQPEVYMTRGTQKLLVEPGRHFGSRFPGDPRRLVVYDYLPDSTLSRCLNLTELAGTLVADKWMNNTDARQCIFHRARIRIAGSQQESEGYVLQAIDHGFVFDGPYWRFEGGAPTGGLYFRPSAYAGIRNLDGFQPWLERVRNLPAEVLDAARRQIPPEWLLDGDDALLDSILEQLWERRKQVATFIENARKAKPEFFLDWQ